MSNTSKRCFSHEISNPGSGLCGIVGRAFVKNHDSNNIASNDEARWHMRTMKHLKTLTEAQQQEFTSTLTASHQPGLFQKTRMPANRSDIHNCCTKSKTSTHNNLPMPKVIDTADHACVSLVDVIDHFLALGIECDAVVVRHHDSHNDEITNPIHNCKEFKEMVESLLL